MKDRHLKKREVRPRLDDELYARLKAAAKKEKRSIVRQVELYIEQGLKRDGYDVPSERIGERLVRLGRITREQADAVLAAQREKYNSSRFGDIAIELLKIAREDVEGEPSNNRHGGKP